MLAGVRFQPGMGGAVFLLDVVGRVVGFLRVGYPAGAPRTGYAPLLALLRRRLTDDEVCAVAAELAWANAQVDGIGIGAAITRVTHELPAAEDIDRIRHRLQACG